MRAEPTVAPSPGVWHDRLAPCVAAPGTWLRFECSNLARANGLASQLAAGRLRRPSGSWKFTARKESGRAWLYACFTDGETPEPIITDGGYTTHEACTLAGVSYRQADYLSRESEAITSGSGQGKRRRWTPGEVRVLWAYGQLSAAGLMHSAMAIVEAHADEIKAGGPGEIRASRGCVHVSIDMTACPIEAQS